MKKISAVFLCIILTLAFFGCDKSPTPTAANGETVTGTFVIKEINGDNVIMAMWENGQELKSGLYSGNIKGKTTGNPHFSFGTIVSVTYDALVQETYPYGITIRSITSIE